MITIRFSDPPNMTVHCTVEEGIELLGLLKANDGWFPHIRRVSDIPKGYPETSKGLNWRYVIRNAIMVMPREFAGADVVEYLRTRTPRNLTWNPSTIVRGICQWVAKGKVVRVTQGVYRRVD